MENIFRTITFFVILVLPQSLLANNLWQDVEVNSSLNVAKKSNALLERHLSSTNSVLRSKLLTAPMENSGWSETIELPLPNGDMQSFSIVESPIVEPGLAAKFPDNKSYKLQGIDDPTASGRADIGSKGFHAVIISASGRFFIDPEQAGAGDGYRSYSRTASYKSEPFSCSVESESVSKSPNFSAEKNLNRADGNLRVYRLAMATTIEYVAAVGGDLTSAHDELIVLVNRVNAIYERDLGIRLVLVANNDDIIFVGADNFTNGIPGVLIDEVQGIIDAAIGFANYDIGHVVSTDSGGLAGLGVVCGSKKANGVTGSSSPTGDAFWIDFVAHEIGHQFKASHTFNGQTGSCSGGNRVAGNAYEPGSGSTILAYAGICGTENIQSNSDATFHAKSIEVIDTFTTTGGGSSCGTNLAISNPNEPVVNAGANFTIPKGTPFKLSGSATDDDAGQTLTYQWDQINSGTATTSISLGDDLANNALFRSYLPQDTGDRDLPALGTQLDNQIDKSEAYACTARDLDFRFTVRDGVSGMTTENVKITVDIDSGPFEVTSHNSPGNFSAAGGLNVTWDIADTTSAPVNCSTVDIDLLTFSSAAHTEYAVTSLVTGTLNDGSEVLALPNQSAAVARIRVKCSNNIFYDISDADQSITGTGNFATTGNTVFFNTNGLVLSAKTASACDGAPVVGQDDHGNNISTATDIGKDDSIAGQIETIGDVDFFKVVLTQKGTLTISTTGLVDTVGTLFDSNGTLVTSNDDEDFPNIVNFKISIELEAGTYFIQVSRFEPNTGISYTIITSFSASGGDSGSSGSVQLWWLLLMSSLLWPAMVRNRT